MKLELTTEEINFILNSLAKGPYEVVYQLIHKIQDQVHSQIDGET
jgi:hypothetical protein